MANNNKLEDIGSAWENTSKTGVKYLRIILNPTAKAKDIILFENKRKYSANSPDYIAYKSRPRPAAKSK